MGGKPAKQEPEKPLPELIKEFKRGIDRMVRDFKREIMKLEADSKKIKKDIEKMVKNKEPKVNLILTLVFTENPCSELPKEAEYGQEIQGTRGQDGRCQNSAGERSNYTNSGRHYERRCRHAEQDFKLCGR